MDHELAHEITDGWKKRNGGTDAQALGIEAALEEDRLVRGRLNPLIGRRHTLFD